MRDDDSSDLHMISNYYCLGLELMTGNEPIDRF